jgi:hypothetical protein
MTEIPIAIEGLPAGPTDPRTIVRGALILPTEPVPVTLTKGNDLYREDVLLGKAEGFRREGDTIYASVTLTDGRGLSPALMPSIEVRDVEWDEDHMLVKHGHIACLHLLDNVQHAPWADRLYRGEEPLVPVRRAAPIPPLPRTSAIQPWMNEYYLLTDNDAVVYLEHADSAHIHEGHEAHRWATGEWPILSDIVVRAQEHDVTCEDRP